MRVAYFSSDTHPYHLAIYPGVGPAFARPLGWLALPLSKLASDVCDVAVVDNRLEATDVALLESLLDRPAAERPPIFFRISDPDMPRSDNANVQFIFRQANRPGVHFATTYDPAGPFLDFVRSLGESKVVPLPYAYDATRELNLGLGDRSRRIFLSGARNKTLYPLRHKIRAQSKWNPLGRLMVFDLKHPGYPEAAPLRHNITHERFIAMAARFTHFFVCGTRYRSELMKYVECAYAGSVPFGEPSLSLDEVARGTVSRYSGSIFDLLADMRTPLDELEERARLYRRRMKSLRDPKAVRSSFEDQAARVLGWA